MFTGFFGDFFAFQEHFHQVDAAAGAVAFVVQFLVRWAGGGAEAAMYAGTQDGFGFLAFWGVGELLD